MDFIVVSKQSFTRPRETSRSSKMFATRCDRERGRKGKELAVQITYQTGRFAKAPRVQECSTLPDNSISVDGTLQCDISVTRQVLTPGLFHNFHECDLGRLDTAVLGEWRSTNDAS